MVPPIPRPQVDLQFETMQLPTSKYLVPASDKDITDFFSLEETIESEAIAARKIAGSDRAQGQRYVQLAAALWPRWYVQGYWTEGRQILRRALCLPDAAEPTTAWLNSLVGAGFLAYAQSDFAMARFLYQESLALFREASLPTEVARVLNLLGDLTRHQGDFTRALSFYQQSLALAQEHGDRLVSASSYYGLGRLARAQGDCARARLLYNQCLGLARNGQLQYLVERSLSGLGEVALDQRDYAEARSLFKESLALLRKSQCRWSLAELLYNLGEVCREQGDYVTAYAHYKESLTIIHDLGDRYTAARLLESFAALAARQDQPERALRLAGAAMAVRNALHVKVSPSEQARLARWIKPVHEQIGGQRVSLLQGQMMPIEEAIAEALAGYDTLVKGNDTPRQWRGDPPADAAAKEMGRTILFQQRDVAAVLSLREREVFDLLILGASDRAIADHLGISLHTAHRHVANILRKTGAASRAEIVAHLLGINDPTVSVQTIVKTLQVIAPDFAAKLSSRERDVAGLLITGASYWDIANRLNISIHTVRRHVSHILQRTDTTSRAEAVARLLNIEGRLS